MVHFPQVSGIITFNIRPLQNYRQKVKLKVLLKAKFELIQEKTLSAISLNHNSGCHRKHQNIEHIKGEEQTLTANEQRKNVIVFKVSYVVTMS